MRLRTLALAALGSLALSAPAGAQQLNLPPDVLGALTELYQTATYLCQNGAPAGCQTAMAIDQQAMAMSNALGYCQQGDQQACAFYQQGVMAVSNAYQTTYGGMAGGGGGVQAYDPTPQHMQNMQTLQNQFNAGQQRYQQQQQSNDRMFQTYMDSLRN
jgi:hypothetical protein